MLYFSFFFLHRVVPHMPTTFGNRRRFLCQETGQQRCPTRLSIHFSDAFLQLNRMPSGHSLRPRWSLSKHTFSTETLRGKNDSLPDSSPSATREVSCQIHSDFAFAPYRTPTFTLTLTPTLPLPRFRLPSHPVGMGPA